MQEMADMELLREYVQCDSDEAFAALVTRYVNLVYSAALRKTGNADAAAEITQAVFIILAEKARVLRPGTVLSGWLYQTARLTAANFLRTEIRRARREQAAYRQSPAGESEAELWPHIMPLLEDAMGRLGEQDRNAISLRFFEGRNFKEVGAALGTGEDAAKMRVARALEKLRQFFARRGVSSTTAIIAGAISVHSVQAAPALLAPSVSAVALAKGAAAGGSALTLAKGALKLMAWTKTKITIAATVITLLTTGTTLVALKAYQAERTRTALAVMQGDWQGTLAADQVRLRLVLHIFKTNDTFRAMLDSVDQGAKDIPVTQIFAGPKFIRVELPALDAEYRAARKADGTEMSGTFKQAGRSFPMTFTKTMEAARVAAPLAVDDYAPRRDSDLQGQWEGTLKAGGAELRLNLKIAEPTAGVFHAQLDSVDQGAMNLPVTSLTYQKPVVRFAMDSINGAFEGKLGGQSDQLKGTWTQMGQKLPLTFRRAAAPAAAAAELDYGPGTSQQVQGHWKGSLKVRQTELHIIFHIGLLPDGSYAATMDSPDQGGSGIPATMAEFTYPNLRLEWQGIGGVFKATLKDGRLAGTWRQGKVSLPLNLERGGAE
jgi:RNA polymerase sigma factor (sigma-70 family)